MLALIVVIPFISFVGLALAGSRLPRRLAAVIGCLSVVASGAITFTLLPQVTETPLIQSFGLWIAHAGGVLPEFRFRLDPLSGTMAGIICFVGFLIHFYSTEYMENDEGHNRFFAYMNLFVGSMLLLVLADDMLLLFLGWEGVGICSYFLIGFWYRDPDNIACAEKAFYLTRIGDIAFMIALLIIFTAFGTWDISTTEVLARSVWDSSSAMATSVAVLLLIAAVAKSAQFPLHVWLPDAMAGPTPVSALLHSSTMVTAGVYLIARFHPFFEIAPTIMQLVAVIGAVTALYAGFTAIAQTDIKRILAYSSISQIGYMFLGLGVGAYGAAMFHFVTHAFFKSLLFLGAGAVSHATDGERNILKLGGLKKSLPVTFWTFTIGAASLAALPLITSGFYSKEAVLWGSFIAHDRTLWFLGVAAALLTGWYATRMVVYTFLGPPRSKEVHQPRWVMRLPLLILSGLALVAGFAETPPALGGIALWHDWIHSAFPRTSLPHGSLTAEVTTLLIASVAGLIGIGIGFYLAARKRAWVTAWTQRTLGSLLHGLSATGLYIDAIYRLVFVRGFLMMSRLLQPEWIDTLIHGVVVTLRGGYQVAQASQSGRLRWYLVGLTSGAILLGVGALYL